MHSALCSSAPYKHPPSRWRVHKNSLRVRTQGSWHMYSTHSPLTPQTYVTLTLHPKDGEKRRQADCLANSVTRRGQRAPWHKALGQTSPNQPSPSRPSSRLLTCADARLVQTAWEGGHKGRLSITHFCPQIPPCSIPANPIIALHP